MVIMIIAQCLSSNVMFIMISTCVCVFINRPTRFNNLNVNLLELNEIRLNTSGAWSVTLNLIEKQLKSLTECNECRRIYLLRKGEKKCFHLCKAYTLQNSTVLRWK